MTVQVDTYYFDASDNGPTDPDTVWTNDANAFDGSTATAAHGTTAGGLTTNELNGGGTNAPSSGATIKSVRGRLYGSSGDVACAITTDGLAETLVAGVISGTAAYGAWAGLTAPAAGWTWATVQALEVVFYLVNFSTSDDAYRAEIEVTSGPTINNFWGAETGGMEETSSFIDASASTANASILSGDAYHYRIGTAASAGINVVPFESVADAGGDYIVGFDVEFDDVTPDPNELYLWYVTDGARGIELVIKSNGDLAVKDSTGALIRTITAPFAINTKYNIEVYFQHTATGTIEVFIDGVSQGEDTSQNLTSGSAISAIHLGSSLDVGKFTGVTVDVNNIYFLSGCTSSADRLGPVEVLGYRSRKDSVTPDADAGAGAAADDVNLSGTWLLAQSIPFLGTVSADYTISGGLAGSVKADDAPTAGPLNAWEPVGTYYFDTSISGPTDADAVFTDDADAFDGSIITFAFTTTAGSVSSNFLGGKGTNAPASGESIAGVRARMYAEVGGAGTNSYAVIYETGGSTLLGTPIQGSGFADWTDWITLSAHSGGWTWSKVQDLEVKLYSDVTSQADFYRVEIEVNTTKSWGDIIASKAVVTMERSGGGGAAHYILLGNDVDGTTRGVDLDPTASPVSYFTVSELTSIVPLSTEYLQLGFETTGGQDFSTYGMLAQILHVPPAAAATSFPPHNPNKLMNNFLVR